MADPTTAPVDGLEPPTGAGEDAMDEEQAVSE